MSVPLRAFKRHYHRTADVAKKLLKTGNFALNMHGAANHTVSSRLATPDPELTVRFVTLMRRFLYPLDPLHLPAVWRALLDEYGSHIPLEKQERVAALLARLSGRGALCVTINGEEFTPEKAYHLIADGGYFTRNVAIRERLADLERMSIVPDLLWQAFYDYNIRGMQLASAIFDVISDLGTAGVDTPADSAMMATINRCIFCLRTDATFTSEEHFMPEALGNYDVVLPVGYVCDECNNGELARLDEALANCPLFDLQKLLFVPYTKQGKLPQLQFNEGTFAKTAPLGLAFHSNSDTDIFKVTEELGDGRVRLNFQTTRSRKVDFRLLARALYKVGLEFIALVHGHDAACQSQFDAARSFVVNGGDFPNNLVMATWGAFHDGVSIEQGPQDKGELAPVSWSERRDRVYTPRRRRGQEPWPSHKSSLKHQTNASTPATSSLKRCA